MSRAVEDDLDARLVRATQGGLPLVDEPWAAIAASLGVSPEAVTARLAAMLADGRIRRIGVVPNHYALGYRANAMSVWDVDDAAVHALGAQVGALEFVSHCYRRPRRLPAWRFNLFAMVHAHARDEVAGRLESIRALLGPALRANEVLYSTRILKKTGLRLRAPQVDLPQQVAPATP
ncbi:MAG: Lrp/AsnC family transcriptional regulator [Proteobacteria bacterium]|nr:Lrp/AsnC family transcriptional regulator [Pseudomonadota bacterium]